MTIDEMIAELDTIEPFYLMGPTIKAIKEALMAGQEMQHDMNKVPSVSGHIHITNMPGARQWDTTTKESV